MSVQVISQNTLSKQKCADNRRLLRIAVFHNIKSGGARRAIYDYMKILSKDGHRFDIYDYTTSNAGSLPLESFAEELFHSHFNEDIESEKRLPLISGYIEASTKFRQLKALNKIGKEIAAKIDKGRYDIAFVHHCGITQAPYLLRYLNTPSVFYSGDPPRGIYEPPMHRDHERRYKSACLRLREAWYGPAQWLKNKAYNRLIKRIYEKNMSAVDVLMANSYYSMETFYKLHGIRAHVVHPGVDTDEFRPLIKLAKERFVLSVGGIEPIKGHDFVIEALSTIKEYLRPRLCIVGNRGYGIEKRYLVKLAAQKNVKISFEENVSASRLVELYNSANLTCCGAVMEPFGLTPLESMACGTPVVAVREGGFRESVSHGEVGYLSDRDPAQFGGFVEAIMDDDSLRCELGRRSREYILSYWTLDRVKRRLLELFEFTIGRHAR